MQSIGHQFNAIRT